MATTQRAESKSSSQVTISESGGYSWVVANNAKPVITAEEMDKMTPQERADIVDSAMVRSWDEVPEPFRSEVLATARTLGRQRRESV